MEKTRGIRLPFERATAQEQFGASSSSQPVQRFREQFQTGQDYETEFFEQEPIQRHYTQTVLPPLTSLSRGTVQTFDANQAWKDFNQNRDNIDVMYDNPRQLAEVIEKELTRFVVEDKFLSEYVLQDLMKSLTTFDDLVDKASDVLEERFPKSFEDYVVQENRFMTKNKYILERNQEEYDRYVDIYHNPSNRFDIITFIHEHLQVEALRLISSFPRLQQALFLEEYKNVKDDPNLLISFVKGLQKKAYSEEYQIDDEINYERERIEPAELIIFATKFDKETNPKKLEDLEMITDSRYLEAVRGRSLDTKELSRYFNREDVDKMRNGSKQRFKASAYYGSNIQFLLESESEFLELINPKVISKEKEIIKMIIEDNLPVAQVARTLQLPEQDINTYLNLLSMLNVGTNTEIQEKYGPITSLQIYNFERELVPLSEAFILPGAKESIQTKQFINEYVNLSERESRKFWRGYMESLKDPMKMKEVLPQLQGIESMQVPADFNPFTVEEDLIMKKYSRYLPPRNRDTKLLKEIMETFQKMTLSRLVERSRL